MVPIFLLPLYGLIKFCGRPKLWPYLLVPSIIFLVFLGVAYAFLFTVVAAAQVFLGPLELPVLFEEAAVTSLSGLIFVFQNVQRFITRAALIERGVYDQLCEAYGMEKLGEIGCCRNIHHNVCFAIGRFLLLTLIALATPTYVIPVLGQAIMVVLFCFLFWLYTWNLVSESLGRMSICTCWDQGVFASSHAGSFVSFGAVATVLEVVPILNIAFMAGNAFGAAILFERFFEEEMCKHHPRAKLLTVA